MERNGESTKRKKIRVNWKSVKVVKTFLQACIEEVARNGHMQALSWKRVAAKLKSSHNFIVDRKQMTNHYNYLKSKYKAWSDLRNKAEYAYDPVTNTFNLTEEEWESEIKGNKYVESLKSTTLLYPNLCAQLYDGVVVMDDEIGESSSQKSESPINEAQETSNSKQNCSSHIEPESPTKKAKTFENSSAEPLLIKSTEEINGAQETSTSKQNRSSRAEPNSSGMEQIGESTKRKKFRISWTSVKVVKTFLQACIVEAENGHMQASSWIKVAEKLKSNHNFVVDQKQMKNHYAYLKSKYKAWSELRSKAEYIYDPVTNTFNLTEEEWETEIKRNKFVESLKSTTLDFPNLCAQLYDGVVLVDDQIEESSSQKSRSCPKPISIKYAKEINEAHETSTSKQNCSSHIEPKSPTKKSKTLKDPSAEPILIKNTEAINGSTSKLNWSSHVEHERLAKKAKTLNNPIINVTEDDVSNALKLFVTENDGPSFKDCRDKLCRLGWGAKNALHKMALVIFCESAVYRDAWMQLEDDEVEDWVRMVGHKLRLAA